MPRWLFPLQCLALALALTWPAPARFFAEAVGSAEADGPKHLWTLWWMRAEALSGPAGLRTTLVNWPLGIELYPVEPLNGLVALLLPLGPVPLSNLLAILHLFLLGLCAGWLGRLVSERPLGAHVAGALAQGSAFAAFTLHVGVGELRQAWWIPLGLAVLHRARATGEWRWFLALAGTLAGATLACFYHGFFLATAVATWALATLRPRPALLAKYAVAAALSVAVVVPVVRTFSASYAPREDKRAASFSAWMEMRWELDTYRGAALDPVELLTPRDVATVDRQTANYTGGRYLGWTVLLLGAIGLAAAPRKALPWVGVGAVGLVLACGTVLWWDGALAGGGGRIVLPLATINRALAYVAEPMNFPARFVVLPTVALAVLGALATRWRWSAALVPLALVEVAWGDLVPYPRATIALPAMDRAAFAAAALPPGALAEMTAFTRPAPPNGGGGGGGGASALLSRLDAEARTRAIAAQVATGRPLSTIPIERVDHWGPEGLAWTATLPLARALGGEAVGDAGLRESAAKLAAEGYAGVLVTHACGQRPPGAASGLDRAFGAPIALGCGTIWPVPVGGGGGR